MVWRPPKTNWSAPDGLRDADLNRIEENILELSKQVAMDNIFFYVSASGNDNNDGSYSAPFATISKALSAIPKNLNGKLCIISIAPGAYNEEITIRGNHNGIVQLTSATSGTVTAQHLNISDGAIVELSYMTLALSRGVSVTRGSSLLAGNSTIRNTGYANALVASHDSAAQVQNLDFGASSIFGIEANYNARVFVDAVSGTATGYAFHASRGGIISYNINSATGITFTGSGGRVNTGA